MKSRPSSILNVHSLRAVAALMVVLLHASEQIDVGVLGFPTKFGNSGVDIFFVISGFVMVFSSTVRPRRAGAFIMDRLLRIVPMYWAFTVLTVLLILVMPSAFRGSAFEPVHTFMSFLFVAYPHPVNEGSLSPVLRVGWTLNYEMFFYVIFAAAIAIRPTMRVGISVSVLLLIWLARPFASGSDVALFYTSGIMLEFGFGMLVAVAFTKGLLDRVPFWLGLSLVIGGGAVLIAFGESIEPEDPARFLWFGMPAILILTGAISLERFRKAPLHPVVALLGAASYVIYLTHPFVLTAGRLVTQKLGIDQTTLLNNMLSILVLMALSAAIGVVVHLWFERPVTNAIKQYMRKAGAPNA